MGYEHNIENIKKNGLIMLDTSIKVYNPATDSGTFSFSFYGQKLVLKKKNFMHAILYGKIEDEGFNVKDVDIPYPTSNTVITIEYEIQPYE